MRDQKRDLKRGQKKRESGEREAQRQGSNDFLKNFTALPLLLAFFMGFSSGIPLLLTLRTLQAWMTDVGVDLTTIGIFALVGLPYTFKFIWSPLMDRYNLGFLGRRRGWMFVSQVGLVLMISVMAFTNPQTHKWWMAFWALCVAFFSVLTISEFDIKKLMRVLRV